jgi:DNA-binding NtrC family response regulator/tetratricopeptide (TPR) repeat protein
MACTTDFEDRLIELEEAGVVQRITEDLVLIEHEVTRRRIYGSIPLRQRWLWHEKVYKRAIQDSGIGLAFAARHAFAARLYREAGDLFLSEARKQFESGNCITANLCFAKAANAMRFDGKSLSPDDQIFYAISLERGGNITEAHRIAAALKSMQHVQEDLRLAARIYECLGTFNTSFSWPERVTYFEKLKSTLTPQSESWNMVCGWLGQALLHSGRTEDALSVLSETTDLITKGETWFTKLYRSHALIAKGMFKESLAALQAVEHPQSWAQSGTYNNLAITYEGLGDLGQAIQYQLKCLALAEEAGYTIAQIASYSNLGAFALKLGLLNDAREHFAKSSQIARRANVSQQFLVKKFGAFYADQCHLFLERGLYDQADAVIQLVLTNKDSSRNTVMSLFGWCELLLRVSQLCAARDVLTEISGPVILENALFRTEHSLLFARTGSMNDSETLELLDRIVDSSREMSTTYLLACACLERAAVFLNLGRRNEAENAAKEAFGISQRSQYRSLATRGLLILGRASEVPSDQLAYLEDSLTRASQIGLPELIAEACYHLGATHLKLGHYFIAQEYLVRSTSVTKELVGNVPRKYRKGYLEVHWRRDAQAKLRESAARMMSVMPSFASPAPTVISDDPYTKSLYRLLVTSRTCRSVEDFVPCVIDSLQRTLDRPGVMVTRRNNVTSWHAEGELANDIRRQILAVGEKTGPHGESDGRIHQHGTIAWMGFQGQELTGGLCVVLRSTADRLNEREIEYMSLLAEFVGCTIERIGSRRVEIAAELVTPTYGIVGSSPAIKEVFRHIEIAGRSPTTVLLEGESGTGKELVARAIHHASTRARGPFIPVDCGAIPDTLIESELFGSRKGSFTGALSDRPGLFEAANGGTIFLDEISNTSSGLQAKLLRVIQEREVRRIGETKGRSIDVRLIAATNTNLDSLVQQRQFRQDLLFRLKVLHIRVPALRDRLTDIPQLAEAFVNKLNAAQSLKKHVTAAFLDRLSALNYPGNVRELQNLVERAYFFTKGSAINNVPADHKSSSAGSHSGSVDEVHSWFKELAEGRQSFWAGVHDRYKRRDIPREKVVALVDMGLRTTRGSYKSLAALFQVKEDEYRRFMDFLRRNRCRLDFRPYRKLPL